MSIYSCYHLPITKSPYNYNYTSMCLYVCDCMCDNVHTEFDNYYQKPKFIVFNILKSNVNVKENSLEKHIST